MIYQGNSLRRNTPLPKKIKFECKREGDINIIYHIDITIIIHQAPGNIIGKYDYKHISKAIAGMNLRSGIADPFTEQRKETTFMVLQQSKGINMFFTTCIS